MYAVFWIQSIHSVQYAHSVQSRVEACSGSSDWFENSVFNAPPLALHGCGNPRCVCLTHFYLGTSTDNQLDEAFHKKFGEGHMRSVLCCAKITCLGCPLTQVLSGYEDVEHHV